MRYVVAIGGRAWEVEVDGTQVRVDGVAYEAHMSPIPETPLRHLLLGDRSYTLSLDHHGRGQWSVEFQGERWEVEVIDERTRHIRSLTGGGGTRQAGHILAAPMPGLVLKVEVVVGQAVPAGTGVVVLEAMKMQNELRTTAAATVKAVRVQPGQAVEKGQVLVEFQD